MVGDRGASGLESRVSSIRADEGMDIERFFAFTDTRPDEEKWELIDGEAVLNASPNRLHQLIVRNLIVLLARESAVSAEWEVLPGLAVRVSERSAPIPDVLVRPRIAGISNLCSDMIVAFEVLSPSTKRRDLGWKRDAYAMIPTLARYVVVAQDEVNILSFSRSEEWRQERFAPPSDLLALSELGVSLTLSEIYEGTGLA